MKLLYLKALAMLALLFGTLGLILPLLFSAPSDIAVAGGLFYLLIVFPYAGLLLAQSIKKDIFK